MRGPVTCIESRADYQQFDHGKDHGKDGAVLKKLLFDKEQSGNRDFQL
tara:strand:- start:4394 stop:4537 length:144 start_codon:yes stop_codon:yes gene_type:complete